MEASAVKFSGVKVHREAEPLSAVSPLLHQLGGLLGGGGRTVLAGQAPLTAAWLPDAPPTAPLAAGPETEELCGAAEGPCAAVEEPCGAAAALRRAVAGLPRDAGRSGLTAGVYRIRTTAPDRLYHVLIGEGKREVVEGPVADLTPDVTVTLTSGDLCRLVAGQLSPAEAYSGGRLSLQGNVHLLMALGSMFKEAGVAP